MSRKNVNALILCSRVSHLASAHGTIYLFNWIHSSVIVPTNQHVWGLIIVLDVFFQLDLIYWQANSTSVCENHRGQSGKAAENQRGDEMLASTCLDGCRSWNRARIEQLFSVARWPRPLITVHRKYDVNEILCKINFFRTESPLVSLFLSYFQSSKTKWKI